MRYEAMLLLLLWSLCCAQTSKQPSAKRLSKGYIEIASSYSPFMLKQYTMPQINEDALEIDRVVVTTDKLSFGILPGKMDNFNALEWKVRYQKQNKTLRLQISQQFSKYHWKIKLAYLVFTKQMASFFKISMFIENVKIDLSSNNLVAQIKANQENNYIQKQTDGLDSRVFIFYHGFSMFGPLSQTVVELNIQLGVENSGYLSIHFEGNFKILAYQISLLIVSNWNKNQIDVKLELEEVLSIHHSRLLLLTKVICQQNAKQRNNCWEISYSADQQNEQESSEIERSELMSISRLLDKKKKKCSGKSCTCVSKPNAATCAYDKKCKKCNIKTCVSGYYLSKSVCVVCPPSLTNCKNCGPDLKKKSTVICYVCLPGYVLSNGACVPCPANCNGCTAVVVKSVVTLSCTGCLAPYVLVTSGTVKICSIPIGSFLDTGTSTILPCSPTCLACDSATTCTSCPTGSFLDASFACLTCLTICQTCTTSTGCETCPTANFIMDPTGICVCPTGLWYDVNTNDCLSCDVIQPGCTACAYHTPPAFDYLTNLRPVICLAVPLTGVLLTVGGISILCPDFCDVCSSGTVCTSCTSPDFFIVGGYCQCAASLYYNSISNTCISCNDLVPDCIVCAVTTIPTQSYCTGCNPLGYFLLDSTTCQSCPQTCLSCTSATVCTACVPLPNMISINGGTQCVCNNASPTFLYYNELTNLCQTCGDVILNCQLCDLIGTTVVCNTCNPQYYQTVDSLQCLPCLAQCSSCTTPTACTACDVGYQLVPATGLCICGTACQACKVATANPNCVACTPAPTITCTQCVTGYYISGILCVSCSTYDSKCQQCSNTECTNCISPFTLDGLLCVCDHSQGLYLTINTLSCDGCSTVIPNCLYCSNTTATTVCITCEQKAFFDGTNCLLCDIQCATCNAPPDNCLTCALSYIAGPTPGTCICDTTNGYFYDISSGGCSMCSDLIPHCLACDLFGVCTTCEPQYYYSLGDCLPCPETCKDCLSSTSCTTCPINLVLSSTFFLTPSDQCVCNDPTQLSLFVNPETLYCQICSNIYPGCTNCIPNTNNFDVICNTCSAPTYLYNNQCVLCPNTCTSCTSDILCTGCIDGDLPVAGQCLCDNICKQCLLLVPGCLQCTIVGALTTCNSCVTGMYVDTGVCYSCPSTCDTCTSATTCSLCKPTYILQGGECVCQTYLNIYPNPLGQCTSCSAIFYGCTDCTFSAGETVCQACGAGYFLSSDTCLPCDISCTTCTGPNSNNCLTCLNGYVLSAGVCSCPLGNPCDICNQALAGCIECIYDISGAVDRCRTCQPGLYPVGATCVNCDPSCLTCNSDGICLTCRATYQVINDICACSTNSQMWDDGVSCSYCGIVYPNCISCEPAAVALTFGCKQCQIGSYLQNFNCLQSVCGDGLLTSGEECDDGNVLASDGCGAACQVEINFECSGSPSQCQLIINYGVTLNSIKIVQKSCNLIQMSFTLQPDFPNYQTVNFQDFLGTISIEELIYAQSVYSAGIVTYTFQYTTDIQDQQISIFFLPDNLGIPETLNLPAVPVYITLKADNNVPLVYYSAEDCSTRDSVETVAQALEYSSYAVMVLSMAPAKIVGLELFGVLQLGHLSVGNLDEVNMMMSPLLKMKRVQGFSLSLGDQTPTSRLLTGSYSPNRVKAIGYESNFLRNCNVMLAVVGFVIILSLTLFLLSYCIKRCASGLHSFSKRLIKQVLLTLILFNCFNFAYSAGIHFIYAPEDGSLYQLGTFAAVTALVVPLIMAFALVFTSDEGFGEFKDKFKPGKLQKMYFFVTILYRSGIGLYISTMNSDSKSTLIVLALSIAFLLYNLVNLPYIKAYHNYRANVCHLTQFVSLFVVMYYRTMLNNEAVEDSAIMYTPAYIELTCICISLIVSLAVLIYEIYLFLKQCCSQQKKPEKVEAQQKIQGNNSMFLMTEEKDKPALVVKPIESFDLYIDEY